MSTRSKARRDARRKKMKGASRGAPVRPMAEHAYLRVDGTVVGGAGLRGREWVLVLGGKVIAGTGSAAMILAMLKHVGTLQEQEGRSVELEYSTRLRDAATMEAEAEGKTLDAWLDTLEAERREHAGESDGNPGESGDSDATDAAPGGEAGGSTRQG